MTNTSPPKSHILLVEDDVPLRNVLETALTKGGYSVEVAADGRTAEHCLNTHAFDLIITDVIMPEGDGIEIIMNLHAAKNSIPVIAMTGAHKFTEVYLKTARALGASRVLAKPFRISELLDATRDALSRKVPKSCRAVINAGG